MVIWGGLDAVGTPLKSGGRFSPAGGWSATSMTNAPEERSDHTAVWTGSRMIVWGGAGAPLSLDTGGQYDPTGDVWTPTATEGAPDARAYHTAVWTGTSMLVWGGSNLRGYLNTGARYSPVADSWSPMTLVAAPNGREFPTSVWTGNLMMVWGGLTETFVNSGGRYSFLDGDGDATGDSVDCAPGDPTLYAVPTVTGLMFGADRTTLTWSSAHPSAGSAPIVYDVLRGSIADLPVNNKPSETCVAAELSGLTATDTTLPALGQALWWLVRGENLCGMGLYGTMSDGTPVTSAACP